MAAKLEEDAKRRQEDGYEDVYEVCCSFTRHGCRCGGPFFSSSLRKNENFVRVYSARRRLLLCCDRNWKTLSGYIYSCSIAEEPRGGHALASGCRYSVYAVP